MEEVGIPKWKCNELSTVKIYFPKPGSEKVLLEESDIELQSGDKDIKEIPHITNIEVKDKIFGNQYRVWNI